MALDPRAERAFGSEADAYERHRPGWPADGVSWALRHLALGADAEVVDLAAGTGKLTRELIPMVRRVIAVEPSADMRRALAALVPDAEVLDGTAEALPLPDASVDAVFAAEAFHWFATREAVREIARVVRPGGGLGLMWNMHDFGSEHWHTEVFAALGEVGAPAAGQLGRHELERWGDAFEGAQRDALQVEGCLTHLRVGDGGVALLDQLELEARQVRHLPGDLLEALLDAFPELTVNREVAALDLDSHPALLPSRRRRARSP